MDEAVAEAQLIRQAVAGDRAALQSLLVRHHAQLLATVTPQVPADLHGIIDGDDICQDAYTITFQQIESFRGDTPTAFHNWLEKIAQNKLRDTIRAQRAAKRGSDRRAGTEAGAKDTSSVIELLDLVAVNERTPSRSAARRELVLVVQAAIEHLADDYRQALRLHYVDGLTVAEVAARMKRTPGSVRMLCNRGLQRLAEEIGDPARLLTRRG